MRNVNFEENVSFRDGRFQDAKTCSGWYFDRCSRVSDRYQLKPVDLATHSRVPSDSRQTSVLERDAAQWPAQKCHSSPNSSTPN